MLKSKEPKRACAVHRITCKLKSSVSDYFHCPDFLFTIPYSTTDLVKFLLSQGARPNIQDKKGRTPVMLAAELGNTDIVILLAQNYADLTLEDAEGKGEKKQSLLLTLSSNMQMAGYKEVKLILWKSRAKIQKNIWLI